MDEITSFADKAVKFDTEGRADAAIYFYGEAAASILRAIDTGVLDASYQSKAEIYISRAEKLKHQQSACNLQTSEKSAQQLDLERARFLLSQALDEDSAGKSDDAVNLYAEAVELCITASKQTPSTDLQKQLTALASNALERAEVLKAKTRTLEVPSPVSPTASLSDSVRSSLSLGRSLSPSRSALKAAAYSKEEIEVLRVTSVINGREFVPFMSVDLHERFAYPVPFSDKHGKLALASKQTQRLARWARPDEFLDQPTIISRVNSSSIKQTVVSDCSFIASLAIAARYEERFHTKLITSIIYPQNRHGDPVYNPCGKYMCKFHLNGIPRKIVIDDFLPMGKYGDLLCSFSNNRNELWVSLLEKAYMKIMNGYDFPGSNSNIDLHVLTGWIPERIAIRPNQPDFNKDAVFEKIFERYHKGDCLVTLATGQMSEAEAARAGLVECHAYAMLEVRKMQGVRLFLLKNPWNHLRWKGRFSERDTTSWTPELRKATGYDPQSAQQFDDGEFWIDYESICNFFDVIYVNWRPELFQYTYCLHSQWHAGSGPTKDLYSVGDNPQYSLEVTNAGSSAAVWILLTRHITEKEDFANNREYITVVIYKGDGKKIYYPFDPPPYIEGTRINSPHYLAKLIVKDAGTSRYTLVVSQFEKTTTIYYTLRVFATCEFKLRKFATDELQYKKKEVGEWKGRTAGGCANFRDTYGHNPIYQINLETSADDSELYIDLRGPKNYSVGFDVVQVTSKNNRQFQRVTSGAYRPGFCMLALETVPAGVYNIIPSTFRPGEEGPFFLAVHASCPLKIARLN